MSRCVSIFSASVHYPQLPVREKSRLLYLLYATALCKVLPCLISHDTQQRIAEWLLSRRELTTRKYTFKQFRSFNFCFINFKADLMGTQIRVQQLPECLLIKHSVHRMAYFANFSLYSAGTRQCRAACCASAADGPALQRCKLQGRTVPCRHAAGRPIVGLQTRLW